MKKANFRHLAVRSAIFICLLGLALYGFVSRDTLRSAIAVVMADTEEDPVPVCRAESEHYAVTIGAEGEITDLESTSINAPRTRTGALTLGWIIPEGSFVEAGATIVRFDSTDAALRLEQQQNALKENEQHYKIALESQRTREETLAMDLTTAELEYQHSLDLIPQDETILSKWDMMEAEIDSTLAKSQIDFLRQKRRAQQRMDQSELEILIIERNNAREEMEVAQQTLDSLDVKSPVSGWVLYHRVRGNEPQIGNQYWPDQTLAEIVNLGALQARLHVLERDAGNLKAGMQVSMQLDAFPDWEFRGLLESVAPLPQSLARNSPLRYYIWDARFNIDPEKLRHIRPGMAVHAEVTTTRYDSCFILPASAVTQKDNRNLVFIQQSEDFLQREVQIAPGSHGLAVITDGIEDGEIIALRNPFEARKLYLPDFGKADSRMESSRSRRRFRNR